MKRPLSSTPDDALIPVYGQVLYDFVGWLATHLPPKQPYSRQVNGQFGYGAAGKGWI